MPSPPQGAAPAFEVRDLTVKYGDVAALTGATLTFEGGAAALLGPNGAGKSTLIRTLLGLVRARSGSGSVLGRDIERDALEIRRRVGYSPETDAHVPELEAIHAVALAGELAGMPRREALQRAHEVLDYVGLAEARYRSVDGFSAGMKQRAKLAQALVHDPSLVFLDEPTNGLDPAGRDAMLDLIADVVRARGIHVVLSTHLLPDAERVCDRVILLEGGAVRASAPIRELVQDGDRSFVVRFRGDMTAFLRALRERGLPAESSREGDVVVPATLADATARIVEAVRAAGGQLRGLEPRKRSLADVFFERVEQR